VLVSGAVADKPARLVSPDEPVAITGPSPRYVSRGGEKLAGALERFEIPVAGRRALDVGSSTGGFTDCLIQRGALSVTAVDVGRGQLHERLRSDPRVEVRERTDIRRVTPDDLGGVFDLVVADLSFISLRSVAGQLARMAAPGAPLVVLVKPQFEAGRQEANRGRGVIRRPAAWEAALEGALGAMQPVGTAIMGIMVSPLRGADGNVEFLAHLTKVASDPAAATEPASPAALASLIEGAVAEAAGRSGAVPGAGG